MRLNVRANIVPLLDNANATGPERTFYPGGIATFHVVGNFNGATVALQRLAPDGATWTDVGCRTTFTEPGMANCQLGPGVIRAEVRGGSPTGLYAEIARVGWSTA